MNIRYKVYLTVVIVYIIFIIIEGPYDIWPWGAVIIGGAILIAELGTFISIKRRTKDGK